MTGPPGRSQRPGYRPYPYSQEREFVSSDSTRVQSVRNGWINALRAEVLRSEVPGLPGVASVGIWLATFADADGSNAFPSRETLARLAGCSVDTVTRAVKVLLHVGMLNRRRRPNASAVYQLLIPMERPDWSAHMHYFTDTRQRRAYAKKKAEEAEARTTSTDTNRKASVAGPPDDVHGHQPNEAESVHGHPPTASTDTIRKASVAGPYQYPSTSGRDPLLDHTPSGSVAQPQTVGAREDENQIPPQPQETTAPQLRPVPAPPGGRTTKTTDTSGGQMPLLMSVRTPRHVTEDKAQLRATATPDDVRRAVTELGRSEAIDLYGWRLVGPVINDLDSDTETGT